MQSRLSRTQEKKTKKQLYLSVAGIIIVLFIFFKFGIPALINFSFFLSSFGQSNSQANSTTSSKVVLPAPTLNQPFTATNSATITVSGNAASKEIIQLFVNDSQVDSMSTNDDGTFSFKSVTLSQQQNTIQVKAVKDKSTSDFSDSWFVGFLQKAPDVSVDSPSDGQTFDHDHQNIQVKGKASPDAKVTVNGFWATSDASGNYSYTMALQNGDNHLTVVATDQAGNTTTKELTVHYNQ